MPPRPLLRSTAPKIADASTSTSSSGGTSSSTEPKSARTWISVTPGARSACVRSSFTAPKPATTRSSSAGSHSPWRSTDEKTAVSVSLCGKSGSAASPLGSCIGAEHLTGPAPGEPGPCERFAGQRKIARPVPTRRAHGDLMPLRAARFLAVSSFVCVLAAARFAGAQVPETDDQKTLYALGLAVAENLKGFNLTPEEAKMVTAGLTAGLTNQKPLVDVKDYTEKLDAFATSRSAARAKTEREASTKFMAEAANQKGAQKKASGLVYQETKAGSGDNPTAKDLVKVHYTGKLRDGTVFDSSVQRGQPADFPLARMIPCWLEGLQLMKPGGKAVITCPADLAYGDTGVPPGSGDRIPPGAALQFDVELISVDKGKGETAPPPGAPPKM